MIGIDRTIKMQREEKLSVYMSVCGHIIFDKGAKNTVEKRKPSSINFAGKIGKSHATE